MKITICDNCEERIDTNKLGVKHVSLSIYERKVVYDGNNENNYLISQKEICYPCFTVRLEPLSKGD